jgi:hypothetical protein
MRSDLGRLRRGHTSHEESKWDDIAARFNRGGLLRSRSLNGVGEATVGDFSTYAVSNLLVAA